MTRTFTWGRQVSAGSLAIFAACAFAQDPFCAEINQLIAAVPANFESLIGEEIVADPTDRDGRDECCYAKRNLPGANVCTVKASRFWEPGATYSCHWTFDARDASKVTGFFNAFAASLKICLSRDTWQDESSGSEPSYRAALHGSRHLSKVTLYTRPARAARASITFSFETRPINAKRLRI